MDPKLKQAAVDAVKEACSARSWEQGRKLVADARVERIADRGLEEQVYRVWAPGRPVAPTAIIYVEDEEWDCDCGSRLDACEHAAAAAQALLTPSSGAAEACVPVLRLGYRLFAHRKGLRVERVWIDDTGVRPVEGGLGARKSGVQGGFSPRPHDLKIEQLIIATRGQLLPLETLPSLFGWLESSDEVELEGEAVRVSAKALRYRARLQQIEGGFSLRVDVPVALAGSRGTALVAEGVVRVDGQLHALTHLRLVGRRLEALPLFREFRGEEVVELVGELVPQLQKGMDFDASGVNLPRLVEDLPVGLELELRVRGDGLELEGRVAYGDPPLAHVRGERFVVQGERWPKRNARAEAQIWHKLKARFDLEPGERRWSRGAEARELAARLRAHKGRLLGRAQLKHFGRPFQPRLEAGEGAHANELRLDFVAGEQRVSLNDALAAFEAGESGLALPGGGWAELPMQFMQAQRERLLAFASARGQGGNLPTHALGSVAALCEALEAPLPPKFDKLRPLVEGFEGLPHASLPSDLKAELRAYQQSGVDWLSFARGAGLGAMLCDDMGLGKTLQALCVLEGDALVVVPRSLLHNWAKEAARFRPDLEVCVYHGAARKLPAPLGANQKKTGRMIVTSYGVMRLDVEELGARDWTMVVLDEAQTIKNPDSQVARAAFELRAPFKLTLSGTPVENRLDELWSQAHFANPGMFGGREQFKQEWSRPIASGDAGMAAALRAKLRPVMLRRLKSEVAPELPPRIEVTVHCELSDEERALYEGLRRQAHTEVESMLAGGKSVMSALETLLRLRQASCHPALLPGQRARDSAKLRRLRADLDEAVAAGHKALVFSQWTSLLDLVEPGLREIGVDFSRIDGSTRDRQGVVDAFGSPDGPPVMLLSLMAAGTGLNLVAADHVYFLDPWWNPAVEAQAADRAHRIGQDKPVIIHRLVARNTVDERILALQERKRALAEAVVAEGGGGLTRDDLLALLA